MDKENIGLVVFFIVGTIAIVAMIYWFVDRFIM